MKYQRVVIASDLPEIRRHVSLARLSYDLLEVPTTETVPDHLYVFAYKNPASEALRKMAAVAGKHDNVITFCVRPGSGLNGVIAEDLGDITLVSRETILDRVTKAIDNATA